jgi:hypothetical protein
VGKYYFCFSWCVLNFVYDCVRCYRAVKKALVLDCCNYTNIHIDSRRDRSVSYKQKRRNRLTRRNTK